MKPIRRIVVSLSIALFVVCCGAVLLFNWQVTGWKALTVPTSSMRPTITPGSLVLMHSVPHSTLKVGDVITYANPRHPGSTITHRIIKTYKIDSRIPAFVTKGDNNSVADQPIVAGMVKGKAVWHMPYVGGLLNWTKKPIGLLALVYIPAILMMFEEVQRLNAYWRKSRPYKAARLLVQERSAPKNKLAFASVISVVMVTAPALIAYPVHAALRTNTVALIHNSISVAQPNQQCTGNNTNVNISGGGSGSNSNNVVVNNSNNQSANSGNATNSGNTNGGNATSGNASNTNCTNVNITITNH